MKNLMILGFSCGLCWVKQMKAVQERAKVKKNKKLQRRNKCPVTRNLLGLLGRDFSKGKLTMLSYMEQSL